MADFTIEKVFVYPISRENSKILGYARIQIEGGLFIAELRIFADSKDPDKIYIAFPTRRGSQDEDRKVVYPLTENARARVTAAIFEEYKLEIYHRDILAQRG